MIGKATETGSRRDRGVSVAITHVLTIGITTILIAMLMMSGSTLLETETERSADRSLETIGERIANEIGNVDQIADEDNTDTVTLTVDHPRTVANSGYTVEFTDCSSAPLIEETDNCLQLTAHAHDTVVHVPVVVDDDHDLEGQVTGGTIEISYEDTGTTEKITIEGAN